MKVSGLSIRFSITATIVLLISLFVAFYIILPRLAQVEAPEWILQFTFYALMTAIFGFIFLGILAPLVRERLATSKTKKIEEAESLEQLKDEYIRCAWSIENNIKDILARDEPSDFHAYLDDSNGFGQKLLISISKELERQTQEYNRRLELYRVLLIASKRFIYYLIEVRVKLLFPKSLNNHVPLRNALADDFLIVRYLNRERVTESWFKDSKPEEFKKIVKNIEESERDTLHVFFHGLNKDFEDDKVLQRFRSEKEELVKYGKETVANLRKEADSTVDKLKRYSGLRIARKGEE